MEQSEVQALADKLDKLIERCDKLEKDNALLRELQDDWNRERAQLMHKNDLAKNKIEAMIGRLRALEYHGCHRPQPPWKSGFSTRNTWWPVRRKSRKPCCVRPGIWTPKCAKSAPAARCSVPNALP